MRKKLGSALIVLAVALVAIQFVGPARTNPAIDPSVALATTAQLTPEAAAIIDRSCRDCHSNDTRWPWYSRVAPMSWGVIDHVSEGRRHLNFSKWGEYDPEDLRGFLKDMCALAQKRDMPMPSYTWIHRDARLGDQDIAALCAWTEMERRRR
jgi:hypothetical protein